MTTDTSEKGLERLICIALTGDPCEPAKADSVRDEHGSYGGVGWRAGSWLDYDRDHCFDLVQLTAFIRDTQPERRSPWDSPRTVLFGVGFSHDSRARSASGYDRASTRERR